MNLIGLTGKKGSGKSTIQNYLFQKYQYEKINFADHLKDIIAIVFLLPRDLLEGNTKESREWRELPNLNWTLELSGTLLGTRCDTVTPRKLMQYFSDILKLSLGVNYFVNIVKKKVLELQEKNIKIVIGDIRYTYEEELVRQLGGQIWQINGLNTESDLHDSETQVIAADSIINNHSTFESLYKNVDDLINLKF